LSTFQPKLHGERATSSEKNDAKKAREGMVDEGGFISIHGGLLGLIS
jgi:hypothetical protein